MATSTLVFERLNDEWATKFTSPGSCVIEIERDKGGIVSISANLPGMKPVPIGSYNNPYGPNALFNLNLPQGLEVTVKSNTEILSANMFVE